MIASRCAVGTRRLPITAGDLAVVARCRTKAPGRLAEASRRLFLVVAGFTGWVCRVRSGVAVRILIRGRHHVFGADGGTAGSHPIVAGGRPVVARALAKGTGGLLVINDLRLVTISGGCAPWPM